MQLTQEHTSALQTQATAFQEEIDQKDRSVQTTRAELENAQTALNTSQIQASSLQVKLDEARPLVALIEQKKNEDAAELAVYAAV